ncbi:hypothetical protein OSTOST_10528 [Ostertagia ostertagi]
MRETASQPASSSPLPGCHSRRTSYSDCCHSATAYPSRSTEIKCVSSPANERHCTKLGVFTTDDHSALQLRHEYRSAWDLRSHQSAKSRRSCGLGFWSGVAERRC